MRDHYQKFASWHQQHRHRVRYFTLFGAIAIVIGGSMGVGISLWRSRSWHVAHTIKVQDASVKQTSPIAFPQTVQDPGSYLMVVNKKHPLPRTFAPTDLVNLTVPQIEKSQLRREPAKALSQLFIDAKADGVMLTVASGYRSYDYQKQLYDEYVAKNGKVVAADLSALPGYSEHQSGLAVDIDPLAPTTVNTAQSWLAKNAWHYGFIIRYTPGKDAVTGYQYEPWHIRYVGSPMAKLLTHLGVTLEEFYGVVGGDYVT